MVPKAYITAWRNKAPWQEDFQVEQDLVIERTLMAIYEDTFLKERLAFRGGTTLHKLYLAPAARYSEDIDLVQITAEPFGPIIDRLRERLSFLGRPTVKQKQHNNTLTFRFDSEEGVPLKLKVEVNCREHHTVYGIKEMEYSMDSEWYRGKIFIPTYELAELLGTKMRALYQRKKGRDLFDLWYALTKTDVQPDKIIEAWKFYMAHEEKPVSQQDFINNVQQKIIDPDFVGDMEGLLRPQILYPIIQAHQLVSSFLLEKI